MAYYCEKQHDVSDCAAACLVTIARHYGHYIRVAQARDLAETDLNGTNIQGIIRAASKIGLEAEGLRCNKEALFSYLKYPCIAHVYVNDELYHFVVIYKATKKYIWIGDPARGVMKVKPEVFCGETDEKVNGIKYKWTGVIVTFEKGENFQKNKSTTKDFFIELVKKEKKLLFLSVLLTALCSAIGLGGSFYYKILLDTILPSNQKSLLTFASIGILLAYLLQFIMNLIEARFILRMGKNLQQHLVNTYMEKVLGLPLHFFERRKAGDLVNRFRDADNVKDAVSSVVITIIIDGILAVIGVILLLKINIFMFLWALVVSGGYVFLAYIYNDKFERYNAMFMEYGSTLSSGLIETFNGIETIKAYNMEGVRRKNAFDNTEKLLDCGLRYGKEVNLQSTIKAFFGFVCTGVVLWIGGMSVMDGKLTLGDLILYNSLFVYFTDSIQGIISLQPDIQTAVVAANRILEIIEMEEESKNRDLECEPIGDIEFKNVSFCYRENTPIITDVSLKIKQGEKIAVIGENGSGKSTLFKLLIGYYDASDGDIFIGGQDVSKMNLTLLRSKIGYVNQETFFFAEKVSKNLQYGSENVSEERMVEICKMVKAHEFIEGLPFGYDTILHENGSNLSTGQRQRLALARALIKNPNILILDEFTSNIDVETEEEIKKLLYTEFKDLTIIFITHKVKTFADCDRVYRMDHGKIFELERE